MVSEQRAPMLEQSEKIEFGDIAPDKSDHSKVSTLVVASYNIRYAVGRYLISGGLLRKAGLRRTSVRSRNVAQNIHTAAKAFTDDRLLPGVDVLAIQEADKETARAGRRHVTRELAHELNMSWIHLPAGLPRGIQPQKRQWWLDFEEPIGLYDSGDTGVAVLSRYPMRDVVRIDLPWVECPWRPRLSVGVTIEAGTSKVRLFNSHIDPHSAVAGQMDQVAVVLDHARQATEPTVILGDFNTLSDRKCVEMRRLLEAEGYTTPFPTGTATWRGAGIRLHADWIFVRNLKISRWGVARPLGVSDHWPVWAEIEL